jgi:LPS sulfotransferase NodH
MRFLDFDTGYEGKFDFPDGGRRPEIVYLLASVPRSGSTFLSHLLWRSGCLGAPLEYLNFDGPYAFAAKSAELQQWLWHSVLRRRTSPNGVFGFKCFPTQLDALQGGNPPLFAEVFDLIRRARIIDLRRRDRIAHAISLARADMTGIWAAGQPGTPGAEARYSAEAIAAAERGIAAQSAAWDRLFKELRVEPLTLWYEETVAQPEATLQQVAAFLGVPLARDATITVPAVGRQAGSDSHDWAARYAGDRAAVI